MNDKTLIVKEDELCVALGIARATAFLWRKRGLPVVSKGGPGVSPTYDLQVVHRWLQDSGQGLRMTRQGGFPLEALQAEIGRRAVMQTSAPPAPAPDRVRQRELAAILGRAFERSVLVWAAMYSRRYGVAPDQALNLIEDGLLVLNDAVAHELGLAEADDYELLLPDTLRSALAPELRPQVLEKIAKFAAEGFYDAVQTSDPPSPKGNVEDNDERQQQA